MICGFGEDKECNIECLYYKSCTRKLSANTDKYVHFEKRRGASVPIRIDNPIRFGKGFEINCDEDRIRVECEIQRCMQKYSDIGFRAVTLADIFDLPLDIVKEVLLNVSWCRTNGIKYFYNHENSTKHEVIEDIHELVSDPEALIRKLSKK